LKVLLPDTIDFSLADDAPVRYVRYRVGEPIPAEHRDAEVLVAWVNPVAHLQEAARELRRLKLVQSLAAGPDDVLRAPFAPDVRIASGRGLHDETVAEHALALLLAGVRRLHLMRDAQLERRWPANLGGLQQLEPPGTLTTLKGARVTVWGFGSIAARLAPLLRALGAEVRGVARSAGTRAGTPVYRQDELPALLTDTDALVMILPSTPATRYALGSELLARLPRHAWVVNVGRGDTVDEAALATALRQGAIAGAALDVFEEEPLPERSPLWGLPNLILSPHAAGWRPRGAEALIRRNVERLLKGEALDNEVDRERGY
jgi:phosphoglycerate dehydrogenase-like enzyme